MDTTTSWSPLLSSMGYRKTRNGWRYADRIAIFVGDLVDCGPRQLALPAGISFPDKGGKVRRDVRIKWWQEDLSTYRKAAIGPPADMAMIPDVPMPAIWAGTTISGAPVLFGHYWFTGKPEVINDRAE